MSERSAAAHARRADADVLVEARDLRKHFPLQSGFVAKLLARDERVVHAVDGVDLAIRRGETFGLVGESGCGKTTLGRLLLRLVEPTGGRILFDGEDVTDLPERKLRPLRRRMQLVFQDPHASLNPAMTIGDAVAHPLLVHKLVDSRAEARERAWRMLDEVGLSPVEGFFDKRPADLSGGQKQRVVIARAVVTEPDFLVADEAVSMLDMSVRAKILDLLVSLKRRYGITLVFITHDLATAKFICDRLAIMYLGEIVEEGPAEQFFADPEHPYSRALLKAIPRPDPTRRRTEPAARGEVPDAVTPPAGCRFHPRCPVSTPSCGFTGRDVAALAEDRLTEWSEDARAAFVRRVGEPDAWEERGHDLVVRAEDPAAAREAVARVLADGGPGLAGAVTGVDEGDRDVVVRFREPHPIRMRERPHGRRVLCLLHDGENGVPAGEP